MTRGRLNILAQHVEQTKQLKEAWGDLGFLLKEFQSLSLEVACFLYKLLCKVQQIC